MTKEELKQYIDDNIYENPDGEITGESLNEVLKAIVDDGGTEVEANPTGEATEILGKLKIGKTIYTAPQGPQGERGPQGEQGPQGATGSTGPQGEQGPAGPQGEPGTNGQDGQPGSPGPANTLSIGLVTEGEQVAASITGEAPNQTLNLTLPKGNKGDTGNPGHNPNLGTFLESELPNAPTTNIQNGDYIIVVHDVGQTPPYSSTIYTWDGNSWEDTTTSAGDAFATSELVGATSIIDDFAIGNAHNVLSVAGARTLQNNVVKQSVFSAICALKQSDGTLVSSNSYVTTPLIPIRYNDTVEVCGYSSGSSGQYSLLCTYDEKGNFIDHYGDDGSAGLTTYTFTNNISGKIASFVRVCSIESAAGVNILSQSYVKINHHNERKYNGLTLLSMESIRNLRYGFNDTALRLFKNVGSLKSDGSVDTTVTTYRHTDLLEINSAPIVICGSRGVGIELCYFYDEDGVPISAYGSDLTSVMLHTVVIGDSDIPATAKYFRAGVSVNYLNNAFVLFGESTNIKNNIAKAVALNAQTNAKIDDLKSQLDYTPSYYVFDGNAAYMTFDGLVLSQNGDSIEFDVQMSTEYSIYINIQPYGYCFTHGGATNKIGIALTARLCSLRSDDGTWLISAKTIRNSPTKNQGRFTAKFVYENNVTNLYVDGILIESSAGSGYTYNGQKAITISGIGNGYGAGSSESRPYWVGILYSAKYTHNGTTITLENFPNLKKFNIQQPSYADSIKEELAPTLYEKIGTQPYFVGRAPSDYLDKILASNKDIEILLSGDSVTSYTQNGNPLSNAANLPAGCQYDAITYQLWNALCTNKPKCDRFDSEENDTPVFTESGSWDQPNPAKFNNISIPSDPNYNGISGNGNKGEFSPANLVYKEGTSSGASVSFNMDLDKYEKMNFIYLKGLDGTLSALVSCEANKLEVYDRASGNWLEANGYEFSQNTMILAGSSLLPDDAICPSNTNQDASHWVRNVALKFRRKQGASGVVTITIANNGGTITYYKNISGSGWTQFSADSVLYYWGTEMWNGNTVRIVNSGKAGRNTIELSYTIHDEITERDLDLVIWQVPVWNEMSDNSDEYLEYHGDYNAYWDAIHTSFLNKIRLLSGDTPFGNFQMVVAYEHTTSLSWIGDKNRQFTNSLGVVKTNLTTCECINKSIYAMKNYDANVKVFNLGILVKDFANANGMTMQGILFGDNEAENIGDGTSSGTAKGGYFTIDGTHPSSAGFKFYAELFIAMMRQ